MEKLRESLGLVAWSYVLLHLDFNLGPINILPDWLGYLLILKALPALGEVIPAALLLRPLGTLLFAWDGILWFTTLLGKPLDFSLFATVAAAAGLYFHFQLLTNLAEIAGKYALEEERQLQTLRTVRTLLMTFFFLPLPWDRLLPTTSVWSSSLMVLYLLASLVVALFLCSTLFSLRRALPALREA